MRLEYLYYFKRLAETLNYTKAAKDLYVAQPTLSVAIKRMEQELGFTLFERGNAGSGGTRLTEAGQLMYEHVSIALSSYEKGLAEARETLGNTNSKLRLGTLYCMQGRFFSQALSEFWESCSIHPTIKITQAYSRELISSLHKGTIDVAFTSLIDEAKDLQKVLCWSMPLVLAVNCNSKLASKSFVTVEDLVDLNIITYGKNSPVYNSMNTFARSHGLKLMNSYEDEITMCSVVTANGDLSALCCYSFLVKAFDEVKCLPIKGIPVDFHKIYLMSRKESQPRVVQEFIDFMSKYRFPNVFMSE